MISTISTQRKDDTTIFFIPDTQIYKINLKIAGTYFVTSPASFTLSYYDETSQTTTTLSCTSNSTVEIPFLTNVTIKGSAGAYLFVKNNSKNISVATIDVITSTTTYTATGKDAYVTIIGGGSGGQPGQSTNKAPGPTPTAPVTHGIGGAGGGSGRVSTTYYGTLPGNIPVVIGGGGASDSAGGDTTFGNLSSSTASFAAGGAGGTSNPGVRPSIALVGAPGVKAPVVNDSAFDFYGKPSLTIPVFNPGPSGIQGGGGSSVASGSGGGGKSDNAPNLPGYNIVGAAGGGGGGAYNSGNVGGAGTTVSVPNLGSPTAPTTSSRTAAGGSGGSGGDGAVIVLRYPL